MDEIPVITVLNKCDKLDYELPPAENTVMISAKNGTGFDELLKAISDNLTDKVSRMEMLIPYDKSGLAAALHSHGKVLSEEPPLWTSCISMSMRSLSSDDIHYSPKGLFCFTRHNQSCTSVPPTGRIERT